MNTRRIILLLTMFLLVLGGGLSGPREACADCIDGCIWDAQQCRSWCPPEDWACWNGCEEQKWQCISHCSP